MFGMLQYDARENDIKFVKKAGAFDMLQHSACDYCRRKKLRCSGDSNGCTRCSALSRSCTYNDSSQAKSSRKGRRATRTSISRPPSPPLLPPSTYEPMDLGSVPLTEQPTTITPPPSNPLETHAEEILEPTQALDDMELLGLDLGLDHTSDLLKDLVPLFDTDFKDFKEFTHGLCPGSDASDRISFSPLANLNTAFPPSPVASISPRSLVSNTNAQFQSFSQHAVPLEAANQRTRTCHCLETIVFLLEDLEGSIAVVGESSLDASLASNKGALSSCQRLLRCPDCTTRTETLMLLTFICEKLVKVCSKVVNGYAKHTEESQGLGHSLAVGEYEVSSGREWNCLMRALILLQLRYLSEFLADMKTIGSSALPQSQFSKLVMNEKKVVELGEKMGE
ncbi:hypothetical protein BDV95DRAFT_612012 [Massariosphaeria phaeospora]|uniref:Zn(2)-C6 fungal-type domain-containing protein n=1 Tax=Massariosphaeria phaeospora TaxID=100035 RepID=A0A7C8M5B2_9PLEO|nr:hypothetical protein BDV95DRAFT_612012 [Massariosphaeria phaeospora]